MSSEKTLMPLHPDLILQQDSPLKVLTQIAPTIAASMVCRAISANIITSGDPEGTRTLDLLRDRQAF